MYPTTNAKREKESNCFNWLGTTKPNNAYEKNIVMTSATKTVKPASNAHFIIDC